MSAALYRVEAFLLMVENKERDMATKEASKKPRSLEALEKDAFERVTALLANTYKEQGLVAFMKMLKAAGAAAAAHQRATAAPPELRASMFLRWVADPSKKPI